MFLQRIAAQGIAALVSFLLLILPPAIFAVETYGATLVAVDTIDSGLHTHRVSVQIGNRVEHLLLNEHPHLNQLKIVDSDGQTQKQTSVAYIGIIDSRPNSWARVTISGDFIEGTISSSGQLQHLSSDPLAIQPLAKSIHNFVQARDIALLPPPRKNIINSHANEPLFEEVVVTPDRTLTYRTGSATRVANIALVIDPLYNEAVAGRGLSKAISIMNSVDGIFREEFGLAIKVDVIVLITDDTTLVLDGDTLVKNLEIFRAYRIASDQLPIDLDLVHLFTGVGDPTSALVGLAYKNTVCRPDGFDVAMSRQYLDPVLLAAHEIGHNLGASHDDETTECRDINDHMMFSDITNITTKEFSSCSVKDINIKLNQSPCLTNAIDIGLQITQLESNQVLASVTNNDLERAFPSATLQIDLINAAITEAPANCQLENPAQLICTVPATYAGDTQDLAVKLRLEPDTERTVNMRLTPNGFFDLNNENDAATLVIPDEPLTLASTDGQVTVQGGNAGSSGGGTLDALLLWMLLSLGLYNIGIHMSRRRVRAKLNA